MTREEYINICSSCANRGFDPSRGLICSLSSDLPAFEDKCEDFKKDETIKERQAVAESIEEERDTSSAKNDVIWGAVWCAGGLIATLADLGYVFWGAIVFGGFQLIKGLSNGGGKAL
ncbi:MAG: hypothetical protein NXI09_00095 [Bacteroidetes bacterium]|nr:hypothetical protein [Bacteroidota bacterium]